MLGVGERSPFVGRERERELLNGSLAEARRGRGRFVLLAGEPGIGKTRLLSEWAELARTDGWQVLAGRAYETEGMPPYLPIAEALRGYLRDCPLNDLRVLVGDVGPEVAIVAPELRRRLPELPDSTAALGDHGRFRLFESVSEFLIAAARSSPAGLLLSLDDLHWADKPTLLLLLHLARKLGSDSVESVPLMLAGAYRTVDLNRTHPLVDLLADLNRERLEERLLLKPLSLQESGALIQGLTGVTAPQPLLMAIEREAEGNPFFLEPVMNFRLVGWEHGDSETLSQRCQ